MNRQEESSNRIPVFLCVTDDAFALEMRGTIVTPGVPRNFSDVRLKPGDLLALVRPDGSRLHARLRAEAVSLNLKHPFLPLLIADIKKADVPPGTEIWWCGPNEVETAVT